MVSIAAITGFVLLWLPEVAQAGISFNGLD
jgi:hypothetical protein